MRPGACPGGPRRTATWRCCLRTPVGRITGLTMMVVVGTTAPSRRRSICFVSALTRKVPRLVPLGRCLRNGNSLFPTKRSKSKMTQKPVTQARSPIWFLAVSCSVRAGTSNCLRGYSVRPDPHEFRTNCSNYQDAVAPIRWLSSSCGRSTAHFTASAVESCPLLLDHHTERCRLKHDAINLDRIMLYESLICRMIFCE